MTRERAIELLEHVVKRGRVDDGDYGITDDSTLDALEMAISALKDSKSKGEWINGDKTRWKCSVCHYGVLDWNNTPFCPNCGADMRKAEKPETCKGCLEPCIMYEPDMRACKNKVTER